ncbi:S8 family serine peptidase [Solirubrobacter soli]|uniref:S8 family serine peptidase n=1 Tax=Solirubrobacter soli TaxID=363832 RepID=UPI0004153D34|nr:S8 family serine peptidase [Solirubrobacter soli]
MFELRRARLVACCAATLTVAGAVAANASPTAAQAPALGSADQGGAVIVWLKNDHADLDLRSSARAAAAHADQQPIVAAIRAAGGSDIVQLVSVNAVAAHVSAAGVAALRALPAVKEIIPDAGVPIGDPEPTGPAVTGVRITPDKNSRKSAQAAGTNPFPTSNDCGTQDNPLIEPEALLAINAPAMTNAGLSTEPGHGVIVANDGISTAPRGDLVGNPNFVRPAADGGGSVVVGATPGDTTDSTDGEYYGDASSIDAQGTVLYQYSKELPYSGLPDTCYFKLVGDAPGASLVDTNTIDTPESASVMSESELLAGIDAAVLKAHADVINESYGYSNSPGSYAIHYAANDAAVDAGVTVVASSGDSGVSGTVSSPASDPKIIAAGATNTHRLNAMAYGFTGWVNNDITPLSSGGTTPDNKLVDLVAPGYGGEAACNPHGSDCPANTQTEAFGGTSESSPLIAGAAADVIQAYRDSHNGDSPSPALVKQLLTGTASDASAPADQQGAGLVNIKAAVAAAQQQLNTTATGGANSLIPTPTQLDLRGDGGSSNFQSVSLFNSSSASTTVTGTYRELGPEHQIGSTVTENVSAPDISLAVPADGAQAAPDITINVPSGLDRLDADMIWPDPANGAILSFTLTDPSGRLRQISYDYGTASTTGGTGTVPDIQHVEVANPEAGTWRVAIKWANGRAHLQSLPNVPGTYTGTVSFKASGQNWITAPASPAITIAAHRAATIPLQVAFPAAAGDHPESVQFTSSGGATTSLPIARRTLVPSTGGEFDTQITGTVGRGIGQISTFNVNVPAGRSDLGVTLTTPDTSADDPMTLFLVNPAGTSVATHLVNGRARNGVPLTGGTATYHVPNPMAGTWEIDVELNLTTSGEEFTQTVVGDVLPQAPVITAPVGAVVSTTPLIAGTGVPGDTVTVSALGATVCTAVVGSDGAWSCTPSMALPAGPVLLTATQADATGNASAASTAVGITVPLGSTSTPGDVSGVAPATLSLSLGAPASFGAFTPGVDRTYTASSTADVISSAGDATLSVSDPGHLANGAFSLTDPLSVSVSKSSWSAPVSNDLVTVGFSQHIGASEALRTGGYSRTLTFTLSTTQP